MEGSSYGENVRPARARTRDVKQKERKDAGKLACVNMDIVGNAGKGRTKKRWNDVVKDDLKKCGVDRGLAKDRERWMAQVQGKTSDLCEHGQGT